MLRDVLRARHGKTSRGDEKRSNDDAMMCQNVPNVHIGMLETSGNIWKQVSACLNSFGDAEGPLLGDFWPAPGGSGSSEITDNWATKVFQICQNDQNGSVGSLVRKSCCFSEVYQ